MKSGKSISPSFHRINYLYQIKDYIWRRQERMRHIITSTVGILFHVTLIHRRPSSTDLHIVDLYDHLAVYSNRFLILYLYNLCLPPYCVIKETYSFGLRVLKVKAAFLCMKTTPENLGLCRFYIETIKTIAKKEVLKLHPYMKRNFCKRCCVLLIPGVSAKLRIRSKRQKHTVITCLECGNIRRYPNIPREKKWFDQVDEDADDKTVQHQMAHGNAKQSIRAGDNSVSQQNT